MGEHCSAPAGMSSLGPPAEIPQLSSVLLVLGSLIVVTSRVGGSDLGCLI